MPPNVTARYLGLQLNSPIIVGSSPLTLNPETVRELTLAGAGAVVLPSLFEEQVVHRMLQRGEDAKECEVRLASLFYEESEDRYNGGPQGYVDAIRVLKRVTGIPVIASLNGCTQGRWLAIAEDIQRAGADALEVALETDLPDPKMTADAIEQCLLDAVSDLKKRVDIPVSVKLTSFHTNLNNLAWRLSEAGAAGVTCFAHDPQWQVTRDAIKPSFNWSLTPISSINATLSGLIRVRAGGPDLSLAASGGICSVEDIVKATMAGADTVMVTSEIYRVGADAIAHLLEGLCSYLERNDLSSFLELCEQRPASCPECRGSYLRSVTHATSQVDPTPLTADRQGDRWGHVK